MKTENSLIAFGKVEMPITEEVQRQSRAKKSFCCNDVFLFVSFFCDFTRSRLARSESYRRQEK